jgi:MutS domain V
MQNISPEQFYRDHLKFLDASQKKRLQRKAQLSWLRFFSLAISFLLLWRLWPFGLALAFAAFIIFFVIFIFFVIKDLNNKEQIEHNLLLIEINEEEINILHHHFTNRADGLLLKPVSHEYTSDLDIFGKASLYQYINRTNSEQGNTILAEWLLHPANPDVILQKQESVKELSKDISSLQEFRAHGIANPVTKSAENNVLEWLKIENKFSNNLFWKITRFIFPVVALGSLILYLFSVISEGMFFTSIPLLFLIAFSISKYIMPHYILLDKIVPKLETLRRGIGWIESQDFNTKLTGRLKKNFQTDSFKASASIKQLKKILERLEYRFNPLVYIPLNIFLLWDLQQVMSLEKWKSGHDKNIGTWFQAFGEMEALITIATLHFNHPDWSFPRLSEEHGIFISEDLGHPLIPAEKRVCNSFSTYGEEQLSLITGSNMAGKSTFLRSVGVNIVLAMMGAPVCARRLEVSCMKVMSSMRVNDNLEENTSTFYAELKKLKDIISAVNKNEKVFLLLDEMLRGTNSADRHAGSIALIRQLIKHNAAALIATHDLELTKLSDEFPSAICNYHFDVQVNNDELFFDYKLKTGICTSMNASLLMKKIGIEV